MHIKIKPKELEARGFNVEIIHRHEDDDEVEIIVQKRLYYDEHARGIFDTKGLRAVQEEMDVPHSVIDAAVMRASEAFFKGILKEILFEGK